MNAPTQVFFKSELDGEIQVFDATSVTEFQVNGGPKFVSITADFPVTNQFIKDKGVEYDPKLVRKTVFVEQILQGQASLYKYRGDNDQVFLLKVDDNIPFPLFYKEYIKRTNDIHKNSRFRNQLLEYLSCVSTTNIQTVEYSEKSLKEFVTSYNLCIDSTTEVTDIAKGKRKGITRILFLAGIVNYNFETIVNNQDAEFKGKTSPSVGLEVEAILPFNNNKWSVFLSGQYASYSTSGVSEINSEPVTVATLDLNQLIFNLGGRHYMFLSKSSSIFIETGIVFDYNLSGDYESQPSFNSVLGQITKVNFGGLAGLGYSLNQHLFISAKAFLGASINWDAQDAGNLDRFVLSAKIKL